MMNNASAHHYVQTNGWQGGPWCYVRVQKDKGEQMVELWNGRHKSEFMPRQCFPVCEEVKKSKEGTRDKE